MVETAKETLEETDRHTMAFIYMALRNDALEWYDGLKRDGVDKQIFQQFKEAFLLAYTPAGMARTAMIIIHDLKQGSNESVVNFRNRVIKAADDMEALLPPEARAPTENRYGAEMIAIAAFNNLDIKIMERISRKYMKMEPLKC